VSLKETGSTSNKNSSAIYAQYRRDIIRLLALFIAFFLFASFVAISYYVNQFQLVREEKQNELTSINSAKINQIETWYQERKGDASVIANNKMLRTVVGRVIDFPYDSLAVNDIRTYLETIRATYNYTTYFLLAPDGKILLQDTLHPEPLADEDIDFVAQQIQNPKIEISNLHFLPDEDQIRMDILIPILAENGNGKAQAFVLLRVNPRSYLYPLIQALPVQTESAETLLFRQEGQDVLFLSDVRFAEQSALKERFPVNSADLPAAKALRGETGVVEGFDYRGVKVVAVAASIPDTDWYLLTKEDETEIYADLVQSGKAVAFSVGILLLVLLIGSVQMIRALRIRLLANLSRLEQEKSELAEKFALIFGKGNDILLMLDEDGQIIEINDQGLDALGYSGEEIKTLAFTDLFGKKKTSNSRIQKALSREEKGVRYEIDLYRKEGTSFSAEVSSRYFTSDEHGYYLEIIRDVSERNHTLRLIQESEQKYRSLLEHSTDGIFTADAEGNIIDVNDQGCQMAGYSRDELLTMKVVDLEKDTELDIHPLDIGQNGGNLHNKFVSEQILRRKDGTELQVEVILFAMADGSIQGLVRDISERVSHRKELEEAARKYQQLFDDNPIPLYLYDSVTNKILAANEATLRHYGYSLQDFLNLTVNDIRAEKTIPVGRQPQSFVTGEYISCPWKHVNAQGESIDVEITSHSLQFNGRPAKLEIAVDVTEKLKIEKELKENISTLSGIINASPLGILTSDMDGNITLWNKAAEEIFGWKAEEVMGKPSPIMPGQPEETLSDVVKMIIESKEGIHYEAIRKRKSGELITVDVHGIPLKDYRNRIKGLLAVINDISEIKRVEEANQRLAEERYQLLNRLRLQFNRLPIGFILTDKELNILDWNPQAEIIFGYSRAEAIGKNQFDLIIPPENHAQIREVIQKTTDGKQTEVITHENITKEGKRLSIEWHNTALYDEAGTFIAIMAMAIDVTKRIENEKKIHESEDQLRAFFESPLVGILFGDIYGGIFSCNDAMLGIIGYSREELEDGKIRWDKITPSEYRALDEAAIKKAQDTGYCTPYEKEYIRKDGKRIWVNIGFILIGEEKTNTVVFILDISDRKRAEEELRYRQELLTMTGREGKIGGWEADLVKGVSSWTHEVAVIHDLDPDEQPGVEFGFIFYAPESRPIIEKAFNELAHYGKPYDLDLEIISAKGIRKPIRTTGFPVYQGGKIVKAQGIFQDITEIKQAQAEVKKLAEELEQRVIERTAELTVVNQELESFSYSISHDLRAPIRAIDGFSQIILNEYSQEVSAEVLRYLEIIRQNTKNMGNLVDDLLAFSRLGKQTVQRQEVDTEKLVRDVVEMMKEANPEREIEFVIGSLPPCLADVNLLKQVYINLISNAVKFTRDCVQSRVEIGYHRYQSANEVNLEKNQKYCYYVSDNGVGFDMRFYNKLFGVFQRLHRSEDFEGTGVGLAIVKRVIEKHGGEVWADSVIGEKTTFSFSLGEEYENDKSG
jgi:PAS domain S-box-containing protein